LGRAPDDRCELLCLGLPKAEPCEPSNCPRPPRVRAFADRAKALGDPTRLGLALTLAATDELCVCDLA